MKKISVKGFFKKQWPLIVKSVIVITIIVVLAFGVYFTLKRLGFTTEADMQRLKTELGDTVWLWLIIGALQFIQVIFIPISNQIITIPVAVVFRDELWKVWLTSWLSIWLATMTLYFIGRFGGGKILKWLLRDEAQVKKCTDFISRGWIYYPLGMLLPLPDDIVTVLAGTGKMKVWFVSICSLLTRALDISLSVWGFGYLTQYWWGWILLAVGIVILILITILFYKIDKKLRKKDLENERRKETSSGSTSGETSGTSGSETSREEVCE